MEKSMNLKAGPGYFYVKSAEDLVQLTEALLATSRVGLDTEADSLHHYFEKVCLIQLSFSGSNYVVILLPVSRSQNSWKYYPGKN
jgi:ribonuclease D